MNRCTLVFIWMNCISIFNKFSSYGPLQVLVMHSMLLRKQRLFTESLIWLSLLLLRLLALLCVLLIKLVMERLASHVAHMVTLLLSVLWNKRKLCWLLTLKRNLRASRWWCRDWWSCTCCRCCDADTHHTSRTWIWRSLKLEEELYL